MPVFGLTGNLKCGKSTVLALLRQKGARVFDADAKVHRYYNDKKSLLYKRIAKAWPGALKHNRISRKALGNLVFRDAAELRKLEALVHPVIIKDLKAWIKRQAKKKKVAVAEVPLLFEKKLQNYFSGVILVYVKKEILLARLQRRFTFSKKEAERRLALYLPVNEKIKKADFIVDNSLGFKNLRENVGMLWKDLTNFNR